jgi:hypothetical protein
MGDFSVVLFRPTFMLSFEEHPMKVHKNQWLLTMPSPPIPLVEPHAEDKSRHRRCGSLRSDLIWYAPQRCELTTY